MELLMQDPPAAAALNKLQEGVDAMLVRHMMQAMHLGGKSGEAFTLSVSLNRQLQPDCYMQCQLSPHKLRLPQFADGGQAQSADQNCLLVMTLSAEATDATLFV